MLSYGSLIVHLQNAGIPVADATVTVRTADGTVLAVLSTDAHGTTKKQKLRVEDAPFTLCYLDAEKPGYAPLRHAEFPLYRGITSVRSAELHPFLQSTS